MGPDRLLSLAIHATTDRRASDHPPPTASRTKGQKVMPALVHCKAVSRNAFFRDSTEAKIPAVDVGSGRAGPNLKAFDGEIPCLLSPTRASWDPDIGRPTRNIGGIGRVMISELMP